MMLRLFLATVSLAGVAHAVDFDRTLNVSASPDLYVSTGSGNVRIHPGPDSQIHIHAHIHPGWSSGSDLNDRIARISDNPPIEQSGNTVRVGDVRPEDRSLYNHIAIDYEITAPASVALNLRSGSGDLEVDHLGRFLKAQTGSGSVRAHGIAGPSEVGTGSGDIELEETAAGEVRASTGSGSIRVHGLNGAFTAKEWLRRHRSRRRHHRLIAPHHRLRVRPPPHRPRRPLQRRSLHRLRLPSHRRHQSSGTSPRL